MAASVSERHHLVSSAPSRPGHPGGTMFEDQTVELLPARTTLQAGWGGGGGDGGRGGGAPAAPPRRAGWGGGGGDGGRGGDALAASTAVVIIYGDVINSEITVTSGDA